ncbi:MAG: isocitrate lyase/phosphoenolpyruvate mutase family protein [Polaromonas sp.]|nr:isocitrate lyase/phosphoenolpyruvate mutase family protein [Polaromonas sp.]
MIARPHIRGDGHFKPLATTWTKRISAYPQPSTAVGQGFSDLQIAHWAGLHAPRGTSPEIMDKLAAAVDKAMHDQAFMELSDIADHTARIRDAVDVSLIVDADTGFGNALNTYQTVRTLERAGADSIQIEEQVSPKRCGHFSGKDDITTIEMIGKIKAAADARRDPDLLIMARTDACAVYGFEAALERAQLFSEAGADILFVEAVTTAEEMRALPARLKSPQLMNMVIGGKTPIFSAAELADLGYGIVLYANAALQGAVADMQKSLTVLRDTQRIDEDSGLVVSFAKRLVGKPQWDAMGKEIPVTPRVRISFRHSLLTSARQ